MTRAASTYSFCFTWRICPRMIRAYFAQPSTEIARMMFRKDGPRTAAIASAMMSSGTASETSTIRIRTSSHRPPRYAGEAPDRDAEDDRRA